MSKLVGGVGDYSPGTSVGVGGDMVFTEQAVEMPTGEASEPAGFRSVPLRLSQGLNQHGSFRLIRPLAKPVAKVFWRLCGRFDSGLPELSWKVRDLERIAVSEYHRPLDHVL